MYVTIPIITTETILIKVNLLDMYKTNIDISVPLEITQASCNDTNLLSLMILLHNLRLVFKKTILNKLLILYKNRTIKKIDKTKNIVKSNLVLQKYN